MHIYSLRKGFLLRSYVRENIENINNFYLVFVKYLASKHIDSYYLQDFLEDKIFKWNDLTGLYILHKIYEERMKRISGCQICLDKLCGCIYWFWFSCLDLHFYFAYVKQIYVTAKWYNKYWNSWRNVFENRHIWLINNFECSKFNVLSGVLELCVTWKCSNA